VFFDAREAAVASATSRLSSFLAQAEAAAVKREQSWLGHAPTVAIATADGTRWRCAYKQTS